MVDPRTEATELDAAEMAETSGGGFWSWLLGEPTSTGWGGGSSGGGGASSTW
jgi:uncharacterized membrane protein YgcG